MIELETAVGQLSERFQPHWINYGWHRPLQMMNFLSNFYLFISAEERVVKARVFSGTVQSSRAIKVCMGLGWCVCITNKFPPIFYFSSWGENSNILYFPNKLWQFCWLFRPVSPVNKLMHSDDIQTRLYCIVCVSFQLQRQRGWAFSVNILRKPTTPAEAGD